jgi:hypothetical protein
VARLLLPTLLFCLSACVQSDNPEVTLAPQISPGEEDTVTVLAEELPTAVITTSNVPTLTASPAPALITPTPNLPSTATPSFPKADLSIRAIDITLYPTSNIFAGDLVSIRIDPRIPTGMAPNDVDVRIFLDGEEIVSGNVNTRSLDGKPYGLYQWVWDTENQPGYHNIIVFLDPEDLIKSGDESADNNVASITVAVDTMERLPEAEASARWVAVDSECCRIYTIGNTAAHRDLPQLLDQVDVAFREASVRLSEPISVRYDVFLVDRIFGQGGYTQDAMVVSYLDRDYIVGGLSEMLLHEAVHLIDRQIAPNPITFLSEGLATWVAGGHYQKQDLEQRMAALVEIGSFRALDQTIDEFFGVQHEVAYLEGAGFIDYLVRIYGWEQVKAFYKETTAGDGDTLSEAIDLNLRLFFGHSLDQVESEWLSYLRGLPRDKEEMDNLRTTLKFYNTVRRYQIIFDQGAYYLSTWLPTPGDAVRLGTTADFSRRPESPANIALEALLLSAGVSLRDGDYDRADALLGSVTRVLNNNGAFLDPLALSYLNIVLAAAELGYEAQQIDVQGSRASVHGTEVEGPTLVQFVLTLSEGRKWILTGQPQISRN